MMIRCPFHDDIRPSMKIYGDSAFCFVCRVQVPVSVLNLNPGRVLPKPEPTNIPAMINSIRQLPQKMVRGFNLHYDNLGYYIIWPTNNYYKRRNWAGKSRYTAPSGIKPPIFAYPDNGKHLIVTEGELNAMSLYSALYGEYKIVSPGPASDFARHIKYYLNYQRITLILDHDGPGIIFGVQLKDRLLKENKYATLITMKKDFNQILQDSGEEVVREQFERDIG